MRITTENVEAARDIANQMTDFIETIDSEADTWLDEGGGGDAEERAGSRKAIVEAVDGLNDLSRQFAELNDKWALYETGQSKKLKTRIAELEAQVEALQGGSRVSKTTTEPNEPGTLKGWCDVILGKESK